MHHLCAWREDPEVFECSLPYPQPGDVLSLAQPWYERLMISYRAGDGSAAFAAAAIFACFSASVSCPSGSTLLSGLFGAYA